LIIISNLVLDVKIQKSRFQEEATEIIPHKVSERK